MTKVILNKVYIASKVKHCFHLFNTIFIYICMLFNKMDADPIADGNKA